MTKAKNTTKATTKANKETKKQPTKESVKQPKQKSKGAPQLQATQDGQHVLKRFQDSIAKQDS